MTALLKSILLFWLGWCMSYKWRATAANQSPQMLRMLTCRLLGLLFNVFGCSMYIQATPKLLIFQEAVKETFASYTTRETIVKDNKFPLLYRYNAILSITTCLQ